MIQLFGWQLQPPEINPHDLLALAVAGATWLLPSPIGGFKKGMRLVLAIDKIHLLKDGMMLAALLILDAVEQDRQKAIDSLKQQLPQIGMDLGLPGDLSPILSSDWLAGLIVDLASKAAAEVKKVT